MFLPRWHKIRYAISQAFYRVELHYRTRIGGTVHKKTITGTYRQCLRDIHWHTQKSLTTWDGTRILKITWRKIG